MNDWQNSKYWRRWGAVCRANHWRWIKGRLVPEAVRDAGAHHDAVWRLAETLAGQACRAVTAEDLRHGCHIHALGRDVGHQAFTNHQFDRLLLLWGNERVDALKIKGLLIEPLDLRAQTFWDHPDQQKKLSLIVAIKAMASEAYIISITQDIWGTIYWEDLDATALLGLLRKLKGTRPNQAEVRP